MEHISTCLHATINISSPVFTGSVTAAVINSLQFGFIMAAEQPNMSSEKKLFLFARTNVSAAQMQEKGPPISKVTETTVPS